MKLRFLSFFCFFSLYAPLPKEYPYDRFKDHQSTPTPSNPQIIYKDGKPYLAKNNELLKDGMGNPIVSYSTIIEDSYRARGIDPNRKRKKSWFKRLFGH